MWREHRLEILLVTAVTLLAAISVRTEYQPLDPAGQIERAETKYDLDLGDPHPWFTAWALGDGQAYALIAADVSGKKLSEHVQETAYRYARAGYGWVTALFALGQEPWIPYSLGIVGGISVLAILALAVALRSRLGERTWLMILNPAVFIGFAGDTSEPMAVLLLSIALAVGSWAAALALGVTSPTFLVALWGRWKLLLAGVGAGGALVCYSFFAFGADAMIPDGGRLAAPLVAFVAHSSLAGWVLAAAAVGTMILGLRERDWAWVLSGLFVLCFGLDVLRDPINAWRAAGFLPVLWAFGPGYAVPARSAVAAGETAMSG